MVAAKSKRQLQAEVVLARRNKVWEQLRCGQSVDEIAKGFGVSTKTIERDITWWQDKLGFSARTLKTNPQAAAMDVGMTAEHLLRLARDAYAEYLTATKGEVRARFIQASAQATALRHKVLADAGFLPKVGHDQAEAPTVKISFENRFGKDAPEAVFDDPKSRRKVLEAAYKIINTGMLEGTGTSGEAMNPTPDDTPAIGMNQEVGDTGNDLVATPFDEDDI